MRRDPDRGERGCYARAGARVSSGNQQTRREGAKSGRRRRLRDPVAGPSCEPAGWPGRLGPRKRVPGCRADRGPPEGVLPASAAPSRQAGLAERRALAKATGGQHVWRLVSTKDSSASATPGPVLTSRTSDSQWSVLTMLAREVQEPADTGERALSGSRLVRRTTSLTVSSFIKRKMSTYQEDERKLGVKCED
nr:PREDICTED: uncharacterized protein LOC109449329 isoform X2 [Rhinolophus sinicus]